MQLWFYKAEYGDWKDWLISWWTRGPLSHVELVFSDGGEFGRTSFSSSPRDGGCRFKELEPSDHWEVIDLMPRLQEMAEEYIANRGIKMDASILADEYQYQIRDWCETQNGKAYDWKAVLGFTFGEPEFEDRTKWYCSEVILYALKRFGVWEGKHRVHPNKMYAQLKEDLQLEIA